MVEVSPMLLKQIRRDLHQIPEIGLKEIKTQQYLLDYLNALPQDNLEIKTDNTAILVRIKGSNPTKTIGYRTDIDALPITEATGLDFTSVHQDVMHACGHDFHMTIALGIITELIQCDLTDDILFFFQPAEENMSGAKIYTDNGFLDLKQVDEFYGLHVHPGLEVGDIATSKSTLFAGACRFNVTFIGKESHAAFPHEGNDMIVAATSFIQQAQSILSRSIDPMESAVITFGEIHGGVADNVVAGCVNTTGTIRTLTHETNDLVLNRFKEITLGTELTYNCEIVLELDQMGYVPVVNDEKLATEFIEFFNQSNELNCLEVGPVMTAEDFGYILREVPGVMFWLGVDSEYGLHHAKFNPKEEALHLVVSEMSEFLKNRGNS